MTINAYHEAGHAVMASWLGGEVVSVTVEPDPDDGPRRDGDAAVRWHHRGVSPRELCRRELMAVLAGPAAEMVHSGEWLSLAGNPAWAADQAAAAALATFLVPGAGDVGVIIERTLDQVSQLVERESLWAAIAEVADLLEAHGTVSGDEVRECLARWSTA